MLHSIGSKNNFFFSVYWFSINANSLFSSLRKSIGRLVCLARPVDSCSTIDTTCFLTCLPKIGICSAHRLLKYKSMAQLETNKTKHFFVFFFVCADVTFFGFL
jgi:hypothetical protein